MHTLSSLPISRYSKNEVSLVKSGDAYFHTLLRLIHQAHSLIHLQVYIFDMDETGKEVFEALKQAANRGVKVFVVVDAYASEQITTKSVYEWHQAGIYLKRFSPLKSKRGYGLGRRLHHKICWVDGQAALVGGINIANKYSGYAGVRPWLDYAVEVRGPLLDEIRRVCEEILPRKVIKRIPARVQKSLKAHHHGEREAAITKNDWLRTKVEISDSYRHAIREAKEDITILASYFLPGNRVRRLLRKATERGVNVRIILVGVSDVPMVRSAMRYLYDWLFRNQIEVYEWQPSVLHGKLMFVDGVWTTIGSYNLNALSDYGSLELNVEVLDREFTSLVKHDIEHHVLPHCEKINAIHFTQHKNPFKQFWRWLSYVSIRMALRIMFGLMQNKRITQY